MGMTGAGNATTDVAGSGPVISISGSNEITDDGTLNTDAPSDGNWHWATSLQTLTLAWNGPGGWVGGAILESGTVAGGPMI